MRKGLRSGNTDGSLTGIRGWVTEPLGQPERPWSPTPLSERTRRIIVVCAGVVLLAVPAGLIWDSFPAWYSLLAAVLLPSAAYATRRVVATRPSMWRSPHPPPRNLRRELSQF